MRRREQLTKGRWFTERGLQHGMAERWSLLSPFGLSFLILLLVLRSGFPLMCWECNSFWDWRCLDPYVERTEDLTNCTQRNINATTYVCRKLVQKTAGQTRVIRACGFSPPYDPNRPCYRRSGTFDVSVEYCHCTVDGCNNAISVTGSSVMSLLIAITTFLHLELRWKA